MDIHLVQVPVSVPSLHRWAGRRFGGVIDEGQVLHHLLGELFGPSVLQPFRLLVAPRAQSGTIFAYSDRSADGLIAQAELTATPDLLAALPVSDIASIPRPASTWKAGQRIGFDLRVRPVVRIHSAIVGQDADGQDISIPRGSEIDAYLSAILRDRETTREATYHDWLAKRITGATLDPESTRMASYQRTKIIRNRRSLDGPDVVFHGTMTVTEPDAFAAMLAKGVGRHRAYGYGMLLLRPAQRVR